MRVRIVQHPPLILVSKSKAAVATLEEHETACVLLARENQHLPFNTTELLSTTILILVSKNQKQPLLPFEECETACVLFARKNPTFTIRSDSEIRLIVLVT